MGIVYQIERFVPNFILRRYRRIKRYLIWKRQQRYYSYEIKRLQHTKKQLNVVFLVLYSSVWKYDSVYKAMLRDKRFNPIVLICPVIDRGYEHMIETLHSTKELFRNKGINAICAFDEQTGKHTDVEELKPDILFYSFQWSNHVESRYNVYSLRKYLKCYVNYSYKNVPYEWSIASPVQGLMWLYFSECDDNKKLAQSYHKREFQNIRVVGYPIYDEYENLDAKGYNWKNASKTYKRVIWAPHHTIDGNDGLIKLSTFLVYAQEMLDIAEKYKNSVQFVFKPHPQLKPALYEHKDWGKKRTDDYYELWKSGVNTNICESDYMDLFKSSDAMIHDCGSFIIEYLYTQKPVLYLSNYNRLSQCNEVGRKAYGCHYKGICKDDIINFIEHVVLADEDCLIKKRQEFHKTILLPPNGIYVAENIIKCITDSLKI